MASSCSSNDKRNFQCVTVASVDLIKLPLRDILTSHIKPEDLFKEINLRSTLRLRPDQLKICLIPPPGVPDYNKFDVTLLYTLIRNCCSLPCPAQGWGKEPKATDTQISDDIERLRLFRNNYYAHAESAVISDTVFEDVWKNLKMVFKRVQPKPGCSIDYEQELIKIERTKLTDDYFNTFIVLLDAFSKLEKQIDCRDEPCIFIQGVNETICGGTAVIEADVMKVESSGWSLTWQKRRGDVIKCIDTSVKKYSGSTKKKLVINSVCKEDEGEYQAVLSLESNGPQYKSKNTICISAIGDTPSVEISANSPVCCGSETTIKSVISSIPKVEKIEWQKSKDGIKFNCIGKQKQFQSDETITYPLLTVPTTTFDDELYYRLVVWNGIGESASNIVYLNVIGSPPNITTSLETNVKNRSVKLMGNVVIYDNSPPILETFWTRNGKKIPFETGGNLLELNIDNPSLTIENVSPDDAGKYRLTAINAAGSSTSDAIALAIPRVSVKKHENEKNGGRRITMTIKSKPAPCLVQWSAKSKSAKIFTPIDINAEEYKGTTVSLPCPVLVMKQADLLEKQSFQLDVTNFIGITMHEISGETNPVVPIRPEIVENTLYEDHGASVRFTKLNNILAEEFPLEKLKKMKLSLLTSNKIKNRISVLEAKSALDCLMILQTENLFTQSDVIFMQFLCKETECLDLYEKCVEYAEKQRALCYFEKKTVNGHVDVQFHVQGEISGYTKNYIEAVIETVAIILDCKVEDILLNGVRHSTSFLLTLSVKEVYRCKLSALNERDRQQLRKLNIDYLIIDRDIISLEGANDSTFTLNSEYSLQDLLQCHLCRTLVSHSHCVICDKHVCKDCEGKHISDKSKEHKLVPFKLRGCFTKCQKHSSTLSECYCMECDILFCVRCTSALEHWEHKCFDVMEKSTIQKIILQRDLQELEKSIYPEYHKILATIPNEKVEVSENSKKLTTTIDRHGEHLHREIDNAIKKLKSDVFEMDSRYLYVLNKREDAMTRTVSEITQSVAYVKKLLNSNDDSLLSAYKSRNAEFRILPPKLTVSLPRFASLKMDEQQIYQLFGFLPELSIKTEEHGCTVDFRSVESSAMKKPLISDPQILMDINTGYVYGLHSVSCLKDEHIWTCSYTDNIINLYNLQGELVKSIQTKSGNTPGGIAVTRSGDLVYTDGKDCSVNIVRNTLINTVIKLRRWRPHGVCCTSSGDLLVVMANGHYGETKVVRYSGSRETQTIQYNDKGTPLYSFRSYKKYICENSNLDICVADNRAGAVVVVNRFGHLRFTYTGSPSTTEGSFDPTGITTDGQGRILIADTMQNCIHILDQNGQFLRYIDNCSFNRPCGLCVDTRDNLFVAEFTTSTSQVKKIHYCLQKE